MLWRSDGANGALAFKNAAPAPACRLCLQPSWIPCFQEVCVTKPFLQMQNTLDAYHHASFVWVSFKLRQPPFSLFFARFGLIYEQYKVALISCSRFAHSHHIPGTHCGRCKNKRLTAFSLELLSVNERSVSILKGLNQLQEESATPSNPITAWN